ncbi:MAG: PKD domain-containing protein [Candidatus Wildermuthbacteria bacterium]|nr:PKD domain-containing protein [Candidatus Wildermuthbacteria bacterium]
MAYPLVYLSWTYSDPESDPQSSYQLQVSETPGFGSPVLDTGKVASASPAFVPLSLDYSSFYYWRVRVWDSKGTQSSWSSSSSFNTKAKHPVVDFAWTPSRPALNTLMSFQDKTMTYNGASLRSWSWTFQNGIPSSSSLQNPSTELNQSGSNGRNTVSLTATDNNGSSCSKTASLNTTFPFPQWQEIAPF